MSASSATRASIQAAGRWSARSSRSPGEQEGHDVLLRSLELVTLDGACRVDVLGAYPSAFTDKGATPASFALYEHVEPFPLSAVARVEVIPLGQGNSGRADELGFQAINWTGGVAEHAVDAVAELLVLRQLLWSLDVFAIDGGYVVTHDPRLDPRQLLHEVVNVDDQITNYRKVAQRLYFDRAGCVVSEEGCTRQLRLALDVHSAAAADSHAARPAIRKAGVDVVLDVIEPVEDRPILSQRHVVRRYGRRGIPVRVVPRHPHLDAVRHQWLPSVNPLAGWPSCDRHRQPLDSR